ncbi:hypothetical protein D3C83_131720 [compost metagenome]
MVLANNWLGSGKVFSEADFNYDGKVDRADLGILAVRWQARLDPVLPVAEAKATGRVGRSAVRTPPRALDLVM